MFNAESMSDFLSNLEDPCSLIYGKHADQALNGLGRLQRLREGSVDPTLVDIVEVFSDGSVSAMARQQGLRVRSRPDEFSLSSGWTGLDVGERRRLRQALDKDKPGLVMMSPPVKSLRPSTAREKAVDETTIGLVYEVAQYQSTAGKKFMIEAPATSSLWHHREIQKLMEHSDVAVLGGNSGQKYVTNGRRTAQELRQVLLEMPDDYAEDRVTGSTTSYFSGLRGRVLEHDAAQRDEARVFQEAEDTASRLRQCHDYSHKGCLRLLRGVPWTKLPIGRIGPHEHVRGSRSTVTLGQLAGQGGGSLTRAARLLPETTRYLNGYLTFHGAREPRNTITVTIDTSKSGHMDTHAIGKVGIIALGKFSGGELWLSEDEGPTKRELSPGKWQSGRLHNIHHQVTSFQAGDVHHFEPHDGEKWSVSFCLTRLPASTSEAETTHLQALGFNARGLQDRGPLTVRRNAAVLDSIIFPVESPYLSDSENFPVLEPMEQDDDEEVTEETPGSNGTQRRVTESPEALPKVSEEQKRLVRKLHVNTGHPPTDRFLRTLKAAGALPHVLAYVRDHFHCEDCAIKTRSDSRRRAQCPRMYSFNRALSVDVMYLRFNNEQVPVLNMVCAGTNYHVAARVPGCSGTPSSSATWRTMLETWVRYLGAPSLIISDGGNEFKGSFERGVEQLGCLHHVCAPESPWQNAKSERHGGWLKRRIQQEIDSGRCTFASLSEMDEFLSAITAAKNRWFNHGGHTPVQLVFGELPRVPAELLSDHPGGLVPLSDALHDPAGLDEVGEEFRRRTAIREKAKQMAMESDSKEAIHKALKTTTSPTRRWSIGQWVYVFRRAKPGDALHPTSRWVGPGLVVMNSQGIVWVAMRTRLWRCASEQLRPAFPSEVLGSHLSSDPALADLLRRVTANSRAGAVDVVREGPPPLQQEQVLPVERVELEGAPLPEQANDHHPFPSAGQPRLPSGEVHQAPGHAVPVPPGLVGPVPPPGLPPTPVPDQGGLRSGISSRRSSVEEPAQEAEIIQPLDTVPEESDSPPEAPPLKAARVEESTRAPGTPIQPLLRIIHRPTSSGEGASSSSAPAESPGIPREVSRSPRRLHREEDPELMSWYYINKEGSLTLLAKRSDGVSLKELNAAERELFDQSDELEWEAILKTKAVRVVLPPEADQIRRKWGDRILSSRMVRRRKPLPEENQWKAKSRWCLGGHTDPDTGSLQTYSPTPQGEGMMAFLQVSLNLGHDLAFADVKNAFCQSNKLHRPNGPLYAEPCEGLKLPRGAIIAIEVPVYGLDDAPAAWRQTVVQHLIEDLGFIRNVVEPCWFMKFEGSENGEKKNIAQLLLEVDDFIVSALPSHEAWVKEKLCGRFHFGKWEKSSAEYAGRRVRCSTDRILIDQGKYIKEQIKPVLLEKGRKQDKNAPLLKEEFEALRSVIYKINWVAKESRPEMAGTASIMASRLKAATIEDILIINKCVNHLRNTADRAIVLWKHDPREMAFVVITDAGGITTRAGEVDDLGLPTDATQGAWAVIAAEHLPVGRERVKGSLIAWRSSKLKRKVYSSFGGEAQAMLQGIGEVSWLQVMIRDATYNDVSLQNWRNSLSPHMLVLRGECRLRDHQPQCSVTDAKSLYDTILRESPQGRQDRRAALELAIIVKDLQETRSMVRWAPHQKNIVDSLTKADPLKGNGAMEEFLKQGMLSLVDVREELANRAADVKYKRRSHSASVARLIEEYQGEYLALWSTLIRGSCDDASQVICLNDWLLDQRGMVALSLPADAGS